MGQSFSGAHLVTPQRKGCPLACRPKAKTAAMPGYMSMPDGSFKVVPKEGRPAYIAPNVPKKKAGVAADARPAFIQVCTASDAH